MYEDIIEQLNSISSSLQNINKKVLLIGLIERAKVEYDKNNYDDCISTCEGILKDNPSNVIALRGLGCANQSKGNLKNALIYYKKALKYSEHKEIECTLIGTLYYSINKFEKAIKYYDLAINFNDSYDLAYDGKNQTILEKHLDILDLQDKLIEHEIRKFY